jgi:NitT/TauT family transport system substrate-binding protein
VNQNYDIPPACCAQLRTKHALACTPVLAVTTLACKAMLVLTALAGTAVLVLAGLAMTAAPVGAAPAGAAPLAATPIAKPAPEISRVMLAVGGQSAMIYLPLTVADRLGYFKAEGLEVEINDFNGGSKALQALVGGSADVVAGVYEHTIRMQAAGQHLQAFVVMAKSMQLALAVARSRANQIKTVADLKGMRIGVSAPGSTTNMMVDRVLAGAHLGPNDVSIIGVGLSATAVAAIASGRIDAICTAEAAVTLMERRGLIDVLVDARTEAGTAAVFGGAMATSVLYAQTAFIRDNPRTIQALSNAIVRADQWINAAKPADIAALVPASFRMNDQAVYVAAIEKVRDGYSADGRFPVQGAANTLSALAAFDPKIKPADIDLSSTYTNRFVDSGARVPR